MKRLITKIIPNRYVCLYKSIKKQHKTLNSLACILKCSPILANYKISREDDYVRQMKKAFKEMHVKTEGYYVYPFDPFVCREILSNIKTICSITVDFSKILETDIRKLRNQFISCQDKSFAQRHCDLIDAIEELAYSLLQSLTKEKSKRTRVLSCYFKGMLYHEPSCLDEAIQKLLFFNALFWQANHWHIGLGRLDYVLYKYYKEDIAKGKISRDSAKEMLLNMCNTLGKDTLYKSKTELIGDTGQYILLGGIGQDSINIDNELTQIFLEIFEDYKQPDPKLILRVNTNTSLDIWNRSINCILKGHGSPLIMNEVPIMNNMELFGYCKEDLFQLGTSACWEPLIIGKSFDQNNTLPCIVALKPLTQALIQFEECCDFASFLDRYKLLLTSYIRSCIIDIKYDCSPLFTLFFDDCLKKELDFTEGGATYAYHGIQVVSFPNLINSLLNIKEFVFDKKILTLKECNEIIRNNFEGIHQDKLLLMKSGTLKFGSTHTTVVELTNDLMEFIGNVVSQYTSNGNPIKVGFSSPNYIMSCKGVEASLDGRKRGEPFAVHISPVSSNIDIAEILDFATMLNYKDNRINGNIVDFIIPQSYIHNREKLVSLIRNACIKGLFELQLNVLDYKTLVDAKKNPQNYPYLIVRVWGFSAYFNDLPEIYKDVLIERARVYEAS